ncbi:MAG: endonuclease [Opitutaceae bacterium]|nr:endonuclease [Opitutaceae bacterium]
MLRRVALVLLLVCSALSAAPPPGYYDRAAGLSGGPLKAVLHEIVRGHAVIPYAQLHAPLARLHEDPANPGNVILLYSADSVPKGTDFISAAWNREHAWPRSRGNADAAGPDDSDLHYIWPCYDAVNSTRGNLYFDLSNRSEPGFRAPGHPLAPQTSLDADSWEPPPGQRGALARCLFYVAVRYDGTEPATSDMELVSHRPAGSRMGNLNTLLRWHAQEPVTDAERRRNDLVFSDYQRNRNPFIDQPEWVQLIWGEPLEGAAGTRPLAGVTATVADAAEQPSYAGEYTVALAQAAPAGGLRLAFRLTGSASAGRDFTLSGNGVSFDPARTAGTLTVAAGATGGTIRLTPVADAITEAAETATLVLEPGVGYTVVPNATQTATILLHDQPVLPATWRFDAGAPFGNPLPADTGNALLSFSAWNGTVTSFSGVTGDALALVGSDGNGSAILISLSMAGQRDLDLSFQTRGTATGFSSGTWAWSTDGTTFNALAGVNTAGTGADFSARRVDFSAVTALNNATTVTLRYTLGGATSTAGNARIDDLVVSARPISTPPDAAPRVLEQSPATAVAAGESVVLAVSATGQPAPAYQWFKDGVAVPGGTGATLALPVATQADAGRYHVTVANRLGQAASAPILVTVQPAAARLINVATRAAVTAGEGTLIAGFVIGGTQPKPVLIRGAGPALAGFGVTGFLADPSLELFQGAARLAGNDDWNSADLALHTGAGAFAFPLQSRDAALATTLAPGSYTVQLRPAGPGGATGIALVEVFELGPAGTGRLINLSTRATVGTGQDILIPGVVVGAESPAAANAPRPLLVRAVGPGLADFGVNGPLARPLVRVLRANGTVIAENIGWQAAPNRDALVTASARVGAFPLAANRADSALLLTLEPAAYTIQVSGADGGSGIALVEVYDVP